MTAGKTPPLHVLRRILRHIRSAPKPELPKSRIPPKATTETASNSNSSQLIDPVSENPLHQHVISQYRAAQSASPAQANILRKMAYDFSVLKTDLMERGALHTLDGGAEVKLSPKEMSRLAAHRAGLELPEAYGG
mmetsp:Transcript_21808/g.32343  ORF Transcript_21808/g.32343 Transcript_21808/m.32343 type:complete len:135 (+) Transcript_21808:120-524(+)